MLALGILSRRSRRSPHSPRRLGFFSPVSGGRVGCGPSDNCGGGGWGGGRDGGETDVVARHVTDFTVREAPRNGREPNRFDGKARLMCPSSKRPLTSWFRHRSAQRELQGGEAHLHRRWRSPIPLKNGRNARLGNRSRLTSPLPLKYLCPELCNRFFGIAQSSEIR